MTRKLPAVVLLASLGLGGCAFSEDVVDVPYAPAAAGPVDGAGAVALSVSDARTSFRTRIAMKQNGYGMDGAAIRASRPVPDIVRDALAGAFTQRGFRVAGDGVPVTVSVKTFYTYFGSTIPSGSLILPMNYSGDSHGVVDLAVRVGGTRPVAREYQGIANSNVFLTTGGNAAKAVAGGMQDAIGKMFADPTFLAAVSQSPGS